VLIRSLPAIPTLGLTLDDLPQLMERCQQMMRESIEQLDLQLTKA
jgi:1-acyl-sn-glycerol-3-phosphate acyltransferase